MNPDDLWREFPSSLAEFLRRFPNEAACREYLIKLRWGDKPRCSRCDYDRTWELQNGRFECQRCGFQTSVTAGTLLHGTRKPLQLWFRTIWELAVRKSGINASELQRLMGFGSYETAWTWLHKLRRAMAARAPEQLKGRVVADESYLGGKGIISAGRGTKKKTILIAAEDPAGRIRLAAGDDASEASIILFVQRNVAPDATLVTDGWPSYTPAAIARRNHERHVSPDYKSKDPLQMCHIVSALLKRWWLGTYHGSMSLKYMPAYLQDFTFRFNRRKTQGIGRITARLLNLALISGPVPRAHIVAQPITA